jgi:hypothetical protein
MADSRERVIVRREPLTEKVCPACGRTFLGRSLQRYDTSACQKRADYHRHAAERRAYQRERYRRRRGRRTEEGEGNGER